MTQRLCLYLSVLHQKDKKEFISNIRL